ncbi:hypothetical protein F0225_17365 [Vibrio pectenicida]|uniref:Uncharacterized protein n=1 Tax=Vibrio pectenicida TaxID=62763 RepID=A0A7Y4A1P5_9VIBR|nr:hypothetical protein [Vibrio pectenicida]NOH73091.1 hypothetical protein [Vibrio pectenicida]
MKKTLLTIALSASAFSALAQDSNTNTNTNTNTNSSLFVQDKWINLQTNDTDLTKVQAACQVHGSNYHVPNWSQVNGFKREFYKANQERLRDKDSTKYDQLRQFLFDTLIAKPVGYRHQRKFATPYFLVNNFNTPHEMNIELNWSRAKVNYASLNPEPAVSPTTFVPESSADPLHNAVNAFFAELGREKWEEDQRELEKNRNKNPVLNMCVRIDA